MDRVQDELESLRGIRFLVGSLGNSVTVHLREELLLQDDDSQLFLVAGVQDLIAQDRELSEELINRPLTCVHRCLGLLPTNKALQSRSEPLNVPEILQEDIEEAVVVSDVVGELEASILLVCAPDRFTCPRVDLEAVWLFKLLDHNFF